MRRNAIIVGPPRSGTSMTAMFFKNSGYFVTENEVDQLQPANEFNPHGFWEAEALKQCNREILNAAGFEFNNTWMYPAITQQQADKISTLPHADHHRKLIEDFNGNAPWLWKDPCLSYTIGYWWPLLEPHNARVLLLKRDPEEIYQSFLRLKWLELNKDDKEAALQRIIHHMEAAQSAVEQFDIPHVTVDYADYANAADTTARKIGDFFELELSAHDLGYDKKLKTSGYRGRYLRLLDSAIGMVPDGLRKRLKQMLPVALLKVIFPHRYLKK